MRTTINVAKQYIPNTQPVNWVDIQKAMIEYAKQLLTEIQSKLLNIHWNEPMGIQEEDIRNVIDETKEGLK